MSFLYDYWLRLFSWLTKDSAAHSTALLVFITAWYAVLTYRMSRAMERQTRAMVQPVLHLEICTQPDDPKGQLHHTQCLHTASDAAG
jgi:hypothetical protein